MIGTSLSLGVLTDNPNQEADKRLLDAYGGSRGVLRGLREAGVGAIELRSLRPETPKDVAAACARALAGNLRCKHFLIPHAFRTPTGFRLGADNLFHVLS